MSRLLLLVPEVEVAERLSTILGVVVQIEDDGVPVISSFTFSFSVLSIRL